MNDFVFNEFICLLPPLFSRASDYLLQKTNTNQSNEEKQLTTAGNNKKADFPPIARKRSIFNTDSHLTH